MGSPVSSYKQIPESLNQLRMQIEETAELVEKVEALEGNFNITQDALFADAEINARTTRGFEERIGEYQIQIVNFNSLLPISPALKKVHNYVLGRLHVLQEKVTMSKTLCKISQGEREKNEALCLIGDLFRLHKIEIGMFGLKQFIRKFPSLEGNVYGNLWKLKGSPMNAHNDFGRVAFHDSDGFYSHDIEKAEAIFLLTASLKDRLELICQHLTNNPEEEKTGLDYFSYMISIYPAIGDAIYKHLAPSTIDSKKFGTLAFFNPEEFKKQFGTTFPTPTLDQKKQAIQAVIQTLPSLQQNEKEFYSSQSLSRGGSRRIKVAEEQIALLRRGRYTSPSGQTQDLRESLKQSIEKTMLYRDGGETSPKQPRTQKTLFEVRAQNCVTAAYTLASDPNHKVNVMNFANSSHPGGGYRHGANAQEEELFRCSGLPLALDKSLQFQRRELYPIHRNQHAGPYGGIYTPGVPLFRAGKEEDYRLHDEPVSISVGTFSAFNSPPLDLANPGNPRLTGDYLKATKEKIRSYLKSAYENNDTTLIMGAFGCGSFQNPPQHIVELMMECIEKEYANCFKKIVFCVMKDHNEGHAHNPQGNFLPFANAVKQRGGMIYDEMGRLVS